MHSPDAPYNLQSLQDSPPAEHALLLVKTTESATKLVPEPVLIAPPLKLVKPPGQKPVRELKVGCACKRRKGMSWKTTVREVIVFKRVRKGQLG